MEKFQLEVEKNNELEKNNHKVQEILDHFNIQEGSEVSAVILQKIIVENEQEIIEGISRNFYRVIKRGLYEQTLQRDYYYPGLTDERCFLVHKSKKYNRSEENSLESEEQGSELDLIWSLNDGASFIFTFNADQKQISDANIDPYTNQGMFTGNEAFELKQMAITNFSLQMSDDKKNQKNANDIRESENLNPAKQIMDYDNIKIFLERILRETESFEKSFIQIDKIFGKYKFPLEDAKKLKQAIFEFGNYEFKSRKQLAGTCLLVPQMFNSFVSVRFNIKLKKQQLVCAGNHYEKTQVPSGAPVHYASTYKDNIVIDWTSRQFKDISIPEITLLR